MANWKLKPTASASASCRACRGGRLLGRNGPPMEEAAKVPLSCRLCTFVSCSFSFLCGVWRGGDYWALESATRPVGRPVFLSISELRLGARCPCLSNCVHPCPCPASAVSCFKLFSSTGRALPASSHPVRGSAVSSPPPELCARPCKEQMVIDKASDRRDPPTA